MKKILVLCLSSILILSSAVFLQNKKTDKSEDTTFAIDKIVPGMSSDEFRKTFPGVLPQDDSYNGNGYETASYSTITGNWTYEFAQNILVRASFNSYQILQYNDLKEGSNKATAEFKKFFPSAYFIFDMLTARYGDAKNKNITDTSSMIINHDTYSTDLITAYWEIGEVTINFRASYDGRERPNPNQNYNNMVAEVNAFRVYIEVMGKEEKETLHFLLGETAQEMEKRNPAVFKNGTGLFGSYSTNSFLGDLWGTRSFCFKNGLLQNAGFDYYYRENRYEKEDLTEKKYNAIVKQCRSVKAELESVLGKATSGYDSIPDYKIVQSKGISGTDFMEYEWKTKTKLVRMEFDHHYGGKGVSEHSLSLDVRITDTEGNYSYCDR